MQLFNSNSKSSSNASISNSPYYYSKASFGLMGPVAVVYSLVSRLLFKILPISIAPPQQQQLMLPPPQQQSQPPPSGTQQQRVAIITGSNTGIGYETAKCLVIKHNYVVIMACRSRDKAIEAIARIDDEKQQELMGSTNTTSSTAGKAVFVHPLDLSSCESITKFVSEVEQKFGSTGIDCLINNAGRNTNGPPVDFGDNLKFDLLFMSNFLGHYLLTCKLMKLLLLKKKKPDESDKLPRIVNLSSVMHHFVGNHDLNSEQFWTDCATANDSKYTDDVYSLSKLAALLFSQELNIRYPNQIQSIAVNPGAVNSDIWRGFPRWIIPIFKLLYLTPAQGCHPVVSAATCDDFDNDNNNDTNTSMYLQPYWIPFTGSSNPKQQHTQPKPPFPVFEMMGPYVGTVLTTPRLPTTTTTMAGGDASRALWMACQKLLSCNWPEK